VGIAGRPVKFSREEIEAVISAAHIEAEAKKLGGADKIFIGSFSAKALGRGK
jgi:hypothetical protein